jgi:L-ribulose-5-phosphate 4-epimerase
MNTASKAAEDQSPDGVIKYKLNTIASPSTETSCDEFSGFKESGFKELEAWRSQLYALNLIGQYADGIGYGNLSVRGQNESFYITATQTGHLPELNVSDYPQVVSYSFNDHSLVANGSKSPSSEAPTHSAIYALHPQIATIFHIHSAQMWQYLLKANCLATREDVEYGTLEMAEEIARIYRPFTTGEDIFAHNVFVMAGHVDGIFAFGRSFNQAGLSILSIYNRLLLQN